MSSPHTGATVATRDAYYQGITVTTFALPSLHKGFELANYTVGKIRHDLGSLAVAQSASLRTFKCIIQGIHK